MTEATEHAMRTCSGCGQTDDHPHVIFDDWSGHHDCLPTAAVLTLTRDVGVDPRADARNFAITQALEGVHGDELRAAIADYHETTVAPALAELEA